MEIARLLVGGWSGKKIGWSYRAAMLAIAGQRLNHRKRVPREPLSALTAASKLLWGLVEQDIRAVRQFGYFNAR
jgi:hypothetical protein